MNGDSHYAQQISETELIRSEIREVLEMSYDYDKR